MSGHVAIRDAPVTAGRARSFSRGLSSCTEGFRFGYSCSGYGCHVLSASLVPLRGRSCSGHGCHVGTREPSYGQPGRPFVRGLFVEPEGFRFGYSGSGYGCHVIAGSGTLVLGLRLVGLWG